MFWGSFGAVHLLSLGFGAGLIWSLYMLLRRFSRKVQVMVLGMLSLSGIAAILFNLAMWGSPFEYLPLHLCSLNALVLPFAVFTRNKTLNNLLLLWALGALVALVVNTAQANFILFSPTFCFYFFPHLLEFGIPVLMFRLGLVKKDFRCIATTLPITFIVYTLIHFANLALNRYLAAHHVTNPSGHADVTSQINIILCFLLCSCKTVNNSFFSNTFMLFQYIKNLLCIFVPPGSIKGNRNLWFICFHTINRQFPSSCRSTGIVSHSCANKCCFFYLT